MFSRLAVVVVFSLSSLSLAIAPKVYSSSKSLPDSPVGSWRIRVERTSYGTQDPDLVAAQWIFVWGVDKPDQAGGIQADGPVTREPVFLARAGTDLWTSGGGTGGSLVPNNLSIVLDAFSGSQTPNGGLRLKMGSNTVAYLDSDRSTSSKLVFCTTYVSGAPDPHETRYVLEPFETDPFGGSAVTSTSDGWTETRVVQYLGWYSDYMVPMAEEIIDDLPTMKDDLASTKTDVHWQRTQMESAVSSGSNFYSVLLRALYPSGVPLDGSSPSYLSKIADAFQSDGSDWQDFFPEFESDYFPGSFSSSPLVQYGQPPLVDAFSFVHGLTLPTTDTPVTPALQSGTGASRLGTGYKFRVDLSSMWPTAAGDRYRDITLDLDAFASVRTVIHSVMLGLFTLFAGHRCWDELRRV